MKIKSIAVFFCFIFIQNSAKALDKQKILDELQSLYPYFQAAEIQKKISAAQSPLDFFRSFIPYYYFTIKKYPQMIGPLSPLTQEPGWCVGDAHIGNFGAILNKFGTPLFTINDIDDAGPCPLFTDVLRLLVAVKLKNPIFNSSDFLRAYYAGFTGAPSAFSLEVQNMLARSQKLGLNLDPKKLSAPNTLVRDKNAREFSPQERQNIIETLNHTYNNNFHFIDGYATYKTGGGSHGLTRYNVLVSNSKSQLLLLEFKQLVAPGIFPLAVGPIPSPFERIRQTLIIEQGELFSGLYAVDKVGALNMILFPVWMGNFSVDYENLSDTQLLAVTIDEFYILGQIHRKTATGDYRRLIEQIPSGNWNTAAQNIHGYFLEVFKTVK